MGGTFSVVKFPFYASFERLGEEDGEIPCRWKGGARSGLAEAAALDMALGCVAFRDSFLAFVAVPSLDFTDALIVLGALAVAHILVVLFTA